MSETFTRLISPKRYALIATVLRANITSGKLPKGFVLLEGPIADLMQTSRAPVQAALRILEEEDLIHRFDGRGYLVGRLGLALVPIRRDIRDLGINISDEVDEALQNRGLWELVYDEVEAAVAACLIFGEFRIIEVELGASFGVSRTVVRDVLSRLHERGLVAKNQSSHWIAGPLTAQSVRERFHVRQILEPEALKLAAPYIDYDAVASLLAKESVRRHTNHPAIEWEALERALMDYCILRAPNAHLIELIQHNQMPIAAAYRALSRLGLPEDEIAAAEYWTLFDLISARRIDAAAAYLHSHLKVIAEKNLARLKIVAVVSEAPETVPYLTPYRTE
jgi:DNA-binding GntR family transcriptional regulator